MATAMSEAIALGSSLRRDRAIVMLGLAGVAALSWISTVLLVLEMLPAHAGTAVPHGPAWRGLEVAPLFLMWVLMMAAMMVPAAAPNLLALAGAQRKGRERQDPIARAALFLSGDLLVWTGFSLLAALAQWRLHAAALMSPRMASTNALLSGALLVAAGVFQFTPVKKACLRRCRAPLEDRGGPWGPSNPLASAVSASRDRPWGAFLMGLTHGAFSAGSCAALMLVLFVTGVMSLLWMAVLTGFLVLERIAPQGPWISRVAGTLLAAWGGWMLLGTLA